MPCTDLAYIRNISTDEDEKAHIFWVSTIITENNDVALNNFFALYKTYEDEPLTNHASLMNTSSINNFTLPYII